MEEKVRWKDLLNEKILPAFPMPWAKHGADKKFENYIKHTLKHLNSLKSPQKQERVFLGKPDVWIHNHDSLKNRKEKSLMPEEGASVHDVTEEMIAFFNGMVDWGHPKMGMNVVPPSTLASVAANMIASVFNPNLIEQEYSVNVAAAEVEAVAMTASLAGYDPVKAGGIFTFGGLGTWLYAMKTGLTKALGRESRFHGVRKNAQVLVSEVGHFSKLNCSDWLGLGMDQVRPIKINPDNSMNLDHLRTVLDDCHTNRLPIALICCTTGTTDAFGVDDVAGVVEIRDEYVRRHSLEYMPHVHADSVIGWAWMSFRKYDFEKNTLEFSEGLKKDIRIVADKFKGLCRADSIGIDFHKTGYASYISSLFLLKDAEDFELLRRPPDDEAYLFHFGAYNPGEYSLESSRSAAGALSAWANLKLFGIEGYQVILSSLIEAERKLRQRINTLPDMLVVNPDDHGFVTLYRAYPPGTDAGTMHSDESAGKADGELLEYNSYQHRISTEINRRQREENGPFLSYTSNHRLNLTGKPMAALKIFPMSPFVTDKYLDEIIDGIIQAKNNVDRH